MRAAAGTAARDASLDALRGLAILGMVLSGSVAFGDSLPGWMFHAQVPPPLHRFTPARVGITWVDLVFPFFLFAMGAAMPLALQQAGGARAAAVGLRRFALLLWLALASQHFKAASMAERPEALHHALALAGFVLLGLQLGTLKREWRALRWAAWAAAIVLLAWLPFRDGAGFVPQRQDIILVVLANMALFGTLLWWLTREAAWARVAVLPLLAAVLIGAGVAGSWNAELARATPASWAYQFLFLKYLFIVVPGTLLGDWLLAERGRGAPEVPAWTVAAIGAALVVLNTWLLYTRELRLNLALNLLLLALLAWQLRRATPFVRRSAALGGWLLLLGLTCEALEGGIRKDGSTFSYYFVSGGLACMTLLALRALAATRTGARLVALAAEQGRNPLLAYVAGAAFVLPLLHLAGLHDAWAGMKGSFAAGLAKGLLFTALVAGLTALATRRGWIWRA